VFCCFADITSLKAGPEQRLIVFVCFFAAFEDFRKKTLKRTWFCTGISPLLYGLWTWLKRQKTQQDL